jgi:hypothetical protein
MIARLAIIGGKVSNERGDLNRARRLMPYVSVMMPQVTHRFIGKPWRTPASGH